MAERNFTDEQEKEIAKEYLAGKSARQIARERGLRHHISIVSALDRQRVKQRSPADRNRLYQVNSNAFDKIDNELASYWLGFLYADGTVNKRTLTVNLQLKDKVICERLRDFLDSEHPIAILDNSIDNKVYKRASLSITDNYLVKRLKELGIKVDRPMPHKALSYIPDSLFNHWLRGFFDGDGSAKKKPFISFCGDYELLTILRQRISEHCNTNPELKLVKHSKANLYYLDYCGRVQSLRIAGFMYKDASIWLERKRNVIDSWDKPKDRMRNKKGQFI